MSVVDRAVERVWESMGARLHENFRLASVQDCVKRAVDAGAAASAVEFAGAGMEALILVDHLYAYKVSWQSRSLARTANVLEVLKHTEAKDYVVELYEYAQDVEVLVEEYVEHSYGAPYTVTREQAYTVIKNALHRNDYGPPEYKEDSFVYDEQRGHYVMVDVGFVLSLGARLLEETIDRIENIDDEKDVLGLAIDISYLRQEKMLDADALREIRAIVQAHVPARLYADIKDMMTP